MCRPPSSPGFQLCSRPVVSVSRNSLRGPPVSVCAPSHGAWKTIVLFGPVKKYFLLQAESTYSKPARSGLNGSVLVPGVLMMRGKWVVGSCTGRARFHSRRLKFADGRTTLSTTMQNDLLAVSEPSLTLM